MESVSLKSHTNVGAESFSHSWAAGATGTGCPGVKSQPRTTDSRTGVAFGDLVVPHSNSDGLQGTDQNNQLFGPGNGRVE